MLHGERSPAAVELNPVGVEVEEEVVDRRGGVLVEAVEPMGSAVIEMAAWFEYQARN